MVIKTERFGELDIGDEALIHFPAGILGFEDDRRFLLVAESGNSGVSFLQAGDNPDLAFVVADPVSIRPDYRPEVGREDRRILEWDGVSPLQVLTILTVPEDVRRMTANLMAPILINVGRRIGHQVVQTNGAYSTRHTVAAELERAQRLVTPAVNGVPVTRLDEGAAVTLRKTV